MVVSPQRCTTAQAFLLTIALGIGAPLLNCYASEPRVAPPPSDAAKVILVLIGGNSESVHSGGIWKLYRGRAQAQSAPLLTSVRQTTGLGSSQIATYYFSWTGDDEDDRAYVLPGHWNWIFGGASRIEDSLAKVLSYQAASTQLAIVGWSNGGATAYELACRLAPKRAPNLLVTLDPVAWTTKSCQEYSNNSVATPPNWIDVYTESGLASRLSGGNIIAMIGRAWDDRNLPSMPSDLLKLNPANHGDTEEMWDQRVLESPTYRRWSESLKQ